MAPITAVAASTTRPYSGAPSAFVPRFRGLIVVPLNKKGIVTKKLDKMTERIMTGSIYDDGCIPATHTRECTELTTATLGVAFCLPLCHVFVAWFYLILCFALLSWYRTQAVNRPFQVSMELGQSSAQIEDHL